MGLGPRTALCREDVEKCPICLAIVLKDDMREHRTWHKTMTNLPWEPPKLPDTEPLKFT